MTGVVREGGLEPPCLAARDFEWPDMPYSNLIRRYPIVR